MIFIQQFLPMHFYGNSTDKNLTLNFSLNRFLCGGGLNLKFQPNRFFKPRFLYAGFYCIQIELSLILKSIRSISEVCLCNLCTFGFTYELKIHKGTFTWSAGLILFREPFRAPFPKLYSLITAHKSNQLSKCIRPLFC